MVLYRAGSRTSDHRGTASMLIVQGDIYAQVTHLDRVRELMRDTQARVRAQPGCEYYAFAETLDEPGHFVVVERWRDAEALEAHYGTTSYEYYEKEYSAYMEHDTEVNVYEAQTSVHPVDSNRLDIFQDD
jgi:quinol monooxygenase YgiN